MRRTLLGLLVALAVVAAACGGSDEPDQETQEEVAQAFSCGADAEAEAPDVTQDDAGEPQAGGSLVYGVEAESDGWDPAANRWAISGLMVASSVYDTLTKPGLNGSYQPWLAETVTANEDATVWTITLREGVEFHNGEPLTADAVKQSLDHYRESVLTGTALTNIEDTVVVDDLVLEVRMQDPWYPFPMFLSSQVGNVLAPAMWQQDATERSGNPIGTGPFVFEEWVQDRNFTAVKNDDYWYEGLPYLDEIEFRPIVDSRARQNSLLTGDIDVMHTFTPETIEEFREMAVQGELQAWESCHWGEDEEFLILLNNDRPPFDDPIARRAFALAVDNAEIRERVFNNIFSVATGPFAPTSPWYKEPTPEQLENTRYNPEEAARLVEEYKAAHDGQFSFTLGLPGGLPEARESMQLTQTYLQTAGMDVTLEETEQAAYITNAVFGDYEAQVWRQFGAPDPDGDLVWWLPENAKPVEELSLNMARFRDEELGEALENGRATQDLEERKAQYDIVQDQFRDNLYLLWSMHAFWMVAANNDVHDVVNWYLPDGNQGVPLVGGNHPVSQIWKDQS
jgi:ABC-type transport system substrate-binding protein